MVRSRWIKALVLTLASAGLVRGQTIGSPYVSPSGSATGAAVVPAVVTLPSAPSPQTSPPEPAKTETDDGVYITVQEAGKPGQRCKVLKTWKMEDGSFASQVKAVDTGEIMTIVEDAVGPAAGGEKVRDIASRIFHWRRGKPPTDVPMPPEETEIVLEEKPTVGERVKDTFSRVFHKPRGTVEIEGEVAACPTCTPAAPKPLPVVVSPTPPSVQRIWPSAHTTRPADNPYIRSELAAVPAFKGQDNRVSRPIEPPPSKPAVVSYPKPAIPLPDYVTAKPTDWRRSWGKPEVTKTASMAKKEAPRPTPTVRVELPQADKSKPDPLRSPTEYNPRTMSDVARNRPEETSKPSGPVALPAPGKEVANETPLGAQSVIQSGTTKYVPVPVVTLPGMNQPVGPTGRPPQAPQLNAKLNAFTNMPAPPAPVDTPADMVNAFTPAQQTPNPEAVAASGAFGQGQPVPSVAMAYQYPAYYQRAMMARGMMPMAGGYPQGMYPYGQPMPGYGMQQAGYAHAAHPGHQVAMANPAPAGPTSVPQLTGVLKESMYPSQREWAAMRLADYNGHTQPAAVAALTQAAREDPAAIVRAACVRSLARMGVTAQVAATLQACKGDADPRVQQEAELALSGSAAQPIQQTGRKAE